MDDAWRRGDLQHDQRRQLQRPVLQGRDFHDPRRRPSAQRRWRWRSCPRWWPGSPAGTVSWRRWRGCWIRPGRRGRWWCRRWRAWPGWARRRWRCRPRMPPGRRAGSAGGVLFIDLHGYDQAPVQPGQALDALLRALGVPGEHIPAETEERAGLYRSVLAQISDPVLVVADNASAEAQVRPLLPGAGAAPGDRHLPAYPGRAGGAAAGRHGPGSGGRGGAAGRGGAGRPARTMTGSAVTRRLPGGWPGRAAGCRWRCRSPRRCWPPTRR